MTQVSRRRFIKNAGGASVALWLGLSNKFFADKPGNAFEANFTPYIIVESNGNITLFNTKPEMGQGTFQSIPALIAEEFEVSLDQVTIKLTNGEKEFGNSQSAGGSSSVRTSYKDLRKIGASAKEVFIQAAATKWNVDVSSCFAENGKVFHKTTKKYFSYSDLVEDAA
ncbi:MAG TPA: molybdopterin cofactor-binding domain-containing protein, partial [Chitinophagaceae bacterium]|nr:molybdopterin cofactor-binding domain-containing protein [Chitinophagaceae bacterium]